MDANARRSSVSKAIVCGGVAALLVLAVDRRALADDKQICADSFAAVPTLRDASDFANARKQALECARACGGLSAAAQEFATECKAWADELSPSLQIRVLDASGAAASAATVSIDGRPEADLSKPVRVSAGKHAVHAEMKGASPIDMEVTAAEGKATAVEVRFAAAPVDTKGPSKPTDPAPKPVAPATRPLFPIGIGYGLAAVGLGVGIGTLVAANASPDVTCPTKTDCPAGEDFVSTHNALSNASLWSFVGAGVVAGATTGYLIWAIGGKKANAASELPLVGLVVSPMGWAASARGSFQ